jgi:TolB-like protein/DNA-binding winged helix-turn-helix (wHTH) protein/Tfp pilus assembly protein PilF
VKPTPLPRVVRFGSFEVDRRSRELRKHGLRIKLHEQPFRVLELLLERPGELITREEFQRQIWPADTFVDFERGLNTAINRLRQALGDSAGTPRFIETLPRRGYRFVFPLGEGADAPGGDGELAHRTTWVPAGLWLVLVALAAGAAYWAVVRGRSAARMEIGSIAVLPLDNLSADPQQEYFADGMTDEIITNLAKLRTLRVISRGSTLRYKHSRKPLTEIAKELNVDALVEGTVMRSGTRVRITAQLIRSGTEQHVWADEFEGSTQDVLALQEDVARTIANKIQRELAPRAQLRASVRRRVDPEAYEAYLRGRYVFWQRGTGQSLDSAIREFTRAIEKAPDYAPAYAAMADCYSVGMFTGRPLAPQAAWARAAQAATRALQLDPDLAEAHRALGNIRFRYDWNWAEADREYKRAIELDPNDAQAYKEYSIFLSLMRRTREGEDAARRAEQLDPLSTNVSNVVNLTYAWARRYDDGIQHARKTLELDPNYAAAHSFLARSYEATGRWEDAVSEWLKEFALDGMDAEAVNRFRQAFDNGGMKAFWRMWLGWEEERLRRGERPRLMELARLCYLLDDKSGSFAWLERAYDERDPGLPNIYWAADWLDASRSDPRYLTLAHRMELPP